MNDEMALYKAVSDFLSYSGVTSEYPHDRIIRLLKDERAKCHNQDDRDYWRIVEEKLRALVPFVTATAT